MRTLNFQKILPGMQMVSAVIQDMENIIKSVK
jgi:hypothetical protein